MIMGKENGHSSNLPAKHSQTLDQRRPIQRQDRQYGGDLQQLCLGSEGVGH